MSIGSPTAYLLWAILSTIFLCFMLSHLWLYDKFRCVYQSSGRQPGTFKRLMTYCYLSSLPLLVVYSVTMTALKFEEGYVLIPDLGILPTPMEMWNLENRKWVLPLNFVFSMSWAFEIITHLEELTFWLFLLNQGPGRRDWFESGEFRIWYLGSAAAIIGMPLAAIISRREIETSQAWIFLVGSCAGTSTTLCFLFVIARFPQFLKHVRDEGAEPDVVVRLTTFYKLNMARVVFRFIYTLPLLALALDGVSPPYPLVSDPFWSDFLLMLGALGSFSSSAITLLIFFPRSIASGTGYCVGGISTPPKISSRPISPLAHHAYYDYRNTSIPRAMSLPTDGETAVFSIPTPSGESLLEAPEYNHGVSRGDLSPPDAAAPNQRETVWVTRDALPGASGALPYSDAEYFYHRRQNSVPPLSLWPSTPGEESPDIHLYMMNYASVSPIDILEFRGQNYIT